MPVAPLRARTNSGSSTAAYRIAVLSCRTDRTDGRGSFVGAMPRTALRAGVVSVECCTCGLFYKGFPKVTWIRVSLPAAALPRCRTSALPLPLFVPA